MPESVQNSKQVFTLKTFIAFTKWSILVISVEWEFIFATFPPKSFITKV